MLIFVQKHSPKYSPLWRVFENSINIICVRRNYSRFEYGNSNYLFDAYRSCADALHGAESSERDLGDTRTLVGHTLAVAGGGV